MLCEWRCCAVNSTLQTKFFMANKFTFTDEAGCFSFTRHNNVSRFFVLCTVAMSDCTIAGELLALRRALVWEDAPLNNYFHASEDKQIIRDRVYEIIARHEFEIRATILEKSKAHDNLRASKLRFYQHGVYCHFKQAIAPTLGPNTTLLATTASLGTRREKAAFEDAIKAAMRQTQKSDQWRADFIPSQADPCLQVADYCAWALQRKWEKGDERAYSLIKNKITYEHDLWSESTQHYY